MPRTMKVSGSFLWIVMAGASLFLFCRPAGKLASGPPIDLEIYQNPSRGAIVHHDLRARIDPSTAHLTAIDTLTVIHHPQVPASRPFPFLLAEDLAIQQVEGIGTDVEVSEGRIQPREFWFQPPYDELDGYERARSVSLLPTGGAHFWPERIRVAVHYSGTVYDSLRPPEAAYARGFETTSGLIDPRGAYMSWGTFWVPQRPEERFTFRCALQTPAGWHGVSQGALLSSETAGDLRTNRWDCAHPMEEIYFIGGPYTLRQATHDGVAVMTFTYENTDDAVCQRYIDGTGRYLDLYGKQIGRYPFAKFALVENFWQTGFGMPSFTLLGDQVIRLPFILDTSYGHEILHNWWGNGVFVDHEKGNWCEGLTAYGADYLYKEQEGEDQARDYRRTTLQGYLDYVSEREDLPLRRFREREDFATQAIGYGKSMMVLHQIRRLLGERDFWGALQDFYRDNLFRRASWDDLFEAFGRRGGRDLSGWKEQWLDRTGAPELTLKDYEVQGSEATGYTIRVEVVQVQPVPYDLLVPVRVGWDNGGTMKSVLALSGTEGEITFKAKLVPDWIAVDPDYEVLRRIGPAEIPPALSRTLGADTAVVVLADRLPSELRAAYEALASDWARGARLAILTEPEIDADEMPGVPIWFLGMGTLARGQVDRIGPADCRPPAGPGEGWWIAGQGYASGLGVVLAGGPPDRPERAWGLIDAANQEQVAALGRKIPHYGKYGYLVFEGSQNVAKGSWEIMTSPLRVRVTKGSD